MNQIKTADDLWKNEKLMSLNAELGLSMDALVKIADAMQSQAQQTKIKPALKVVNGEICYQSTDDDQAYGAWCPVVYDTVHDFAEGTKFFAIPPAPEGEKP